MKQKYKGNNAKILKLSEDLLQDGLFLKIQLGGYSMFPFFRAGDIALVQRVDMNTVRIGSVIVFKSYDKLIAHRVLKVNYNNEDITFICKGDSVIHDDPIVTVNNFIGIVKEITRSYIIIYKSDRSFIKSLFFAKMSPYSAYIFRSAVVLIVFINKILNKLYSYMSKKRNYFVVI